MGTVFSVASAFSLRQPSKGAHTNAWGDYRAIETDLIHRAGLTRKSGARSGIVTLIQRFGSALNLNVHLHMIVIDGVYTFDDDAMRFHSVKAPGSDDMKALLDRIIRRTILTERWKARRVLAGIREGVALPTPRRHGGHQRGPYPGCRALPVSLTLPSTQRIREAPEDPRYS